MSEEKKPTQSIHDSELDDAELDAFSGGLGKVAQRIRTPAAERIRTLPPGNEIFSDMDFTDA